MEGSKVCRTHQCEVILEATNQKLYKIESIIVLWDIYCEKSQSHPIPSLYIMGWDGICMGFGKYPIPLVNAGVVAHLLAKDSNEKF